MKPHPSRMLVAALALSLLAACGNAKDTSGNNTGGNAANNSTSNDGANNDGSSSGPDAVGDPADNGGSQIGIDQPDPSKAIFSKQFSQPGMTKNKVTVGILSLRRQDQVLMLKVVVTPEFADKSAGETIGFTEALGPSGWYPTLLDLKNLKKYDVLSGSGGYLRYDKGVAVNGQPIYAWAAFAPPPAGVTSLDLTMTDWMPRFTNVPIR